MKSESVSASRRNAVRPRSEGDPDACVRVLAAVHESDGYPVNWPDRPGEWLSRPSLLTAWVAELGGRLVGHIGLSRSEPGDLAAGQWCAREGASGDVTAVVSGLFVAPEARGHGIGALLMARAVQEAERPGLHPVLDVVASDTVAAALYERLGRELPATVEQEWSPDRTVSIHCHAAGRTLSGAAL